MALDVLWAKGREPLASPLFCNSEEVDPKVQRGQPLEPKGSCICMLKGTRNPNSSQQMNLT